MPRGKGHRIIYIQHPTNENILISKHDIISQRTGTPYKVYLYLDTLTYAIKNVTKRRYIKGEGKISNLHVLKRTAKKHLIKLGCSFKLEFRNRDFGVCPKGYNQIKHKQNKIIPAISQDET